MQRSCLFMRDHIIFLQEVAPKTCLLQSKHQLLVEDVSSFDGLSEEDFASPIEYGASSFSYRGPIQVKHLN